MPCNTKSFVIGTVSGIVLTTLVNTALVLIYSKKKHDRNQISLAIDDYEKALNKIK